jgi:hypothetical protein
MKNVIKIVLLSTCIITFNNTSAQALDDYTKKVMLVFTSISNHNLTLPIYLREKTLMLPSSLCSYQAYTSALVARKKNALFIPSKIFNLTKGDCSVLNNKLLNDSSELNLISSWFPDASIQVVKDSITNKQLISGFTFIKPIFFRNDTRCFMVNFDATSLDAYFLKKVNGYWVFDQFYLRYIDE